VFFDRTAAAHVAERRKRAGHLLSKHRFLALQFDAFLKDDCWLRLARHANAMADRLAAGLGAAGYPPVWSVEANLVFIVVPKTVESRLRGAGAQFYARRSESLPGGRGIGPDQALIRLVTSFATREDEVERFVGLVAKA
jgi:threonine aldolase